MHDRGEGEHRFYGAPGRICGEDRHRAARMRGATSRAAQLRSQPGLQAPGGGWEMPKHREMRRHAPRRAAARWRCESRQLGVGRGRETQQRFMRVKSLPLLRAPTRRPVGMFGDSLVFINNTAVARERVCVCTAAQPVHLPKKGRFTVGRRCPSEAAFHLSKSARKKSQRIIDLSAGRAWRFSAPPLQRGAPAFAARVASARARAGR